MCFAAVETRLISLLDHGVFQFLGNDVEASGNGLVPLLEVGLDSTHTYIDIVFNCDGGLTERPIFSGVNNRVFGSNCRAGVDIVAADHQQCIEAFGTAPSLTLQEDVTGHHSIILNIVFTQPAIGDTAEFTVSLVLTGCGTTGAVLNQFLVTAVLRADTVMGSVANRDVVVIPNVVILRKLRSAGADRQTRNQCKGQHKD